MTTIVTRTDNLASANASTTVKGSALSHTELDRNFYPIKISTNGTVEASKAIVVDSNKDFTGIRHGTFTGTVTAGTLTDGTVSITGGAITGATNIPVVFKSSEYSLSTTSQTEAHGLGGLPDALMVYIKCYTTDRGYSVGDVVAINPNLNDQDEGSGTTDHGLATWMSSTNVGGRVSGSTSSLVLSHKTTGSPAALTPGSWKWYIVALKWS